MSSRVVFWVLEPPVYLDELEVLVEPYRATARGVGILPSLKRPGALEVYVEPRTDLDDELDAILREGRDA